MKTAILILLATIIHARSASMGVLAGSPPVVGGPSSVSFDGDNDRIHFSSSAILMSNTGTAFTACFWVNIDSTAANGTIVQGRNAAGGAIWRLQISSTLVFLFANSAATTIVGGFGDPLITAGTWKHVMFSFDTTSTALRHLYINGVNATDSWTTYTVSGVPALDRDSLYIGADDGFGGDFGGCIAELWIDDVYTDFSNATNRDKFFNAGVPADLGADGSTPFGVAPDLYMKFVPGSLGVNSGADGGTGTLLNQVTVGDCGPVQN